jgi:hypothetical protein
MKTAILGMVVFVSSFCFVAPVLKATVIANAHYDYSIFATDPGDNNNFLSKGSQEDETSNGIASVGISDSGAFQGTCHSCGANSGFANATALVAVGNLAVLADVGGEAEDNILVGAYAIATTTDDSFRMFRLSDPTLFGFLTIVSFIDVHGDLIASGSGDISFPNSDQTVATVRAVATATQFGQFKGAAGTTGALNFTDPSVDSDFDNILILLMTNVLLGQPVSVSLQLEARAKNRDG